MKHMKELGNHKAKSTTNSIRFHANTEQFFKHTDNLKSNIVRMNKTGYLPWNSYN